MDIFGGKIVLCLSKEILDEYVDGLHRVVKDDPSHDKFVECAVKLKAGFIVTGDKSLKSIGEYRGIKIMLPQEFLKIANWNGVRPSQLVDNM